MNGRFRLACVIGICFFLSLPGALQAASVDVGLRLEPRLVKFQASLVTTPQRRHIEEALSEGSMVTTNWSITIEAIRRYWLNQDTASVEIVRRVVPDLVSRTWTLVDISGGVERRVSDLGTAVAFLTHLEEFPIIDRSLLQSNQQYRLQLSLAIRLGRPPDNWFLRWAGHWWGYEETEATLDFAND